MAASAYFDTVQKLYIAFYQRPADSAGLKYWAEQIDAANGNIDAAIQAFSTQEEAVELYGEIDETTIESVLDSIYFAAFGRSPEQEELDYWVPEFVAGRVTPSNIALAVVLGALGTDAATIDNKLVVANEFTTQVDGRPLTDPAFGTSPFAATYDGYDDVAVARDLLSGVTDDPASILSPEDITTAIVDTIADEGDAIIPVEPAPTFSLTADADSADEGDTVTFTVEGGKANFTYNYELTGVDATDVEGGVLTGSVTTDADGNGTFEVTLAADRATDGADTLTATLPNTGLSASVTVNDTSLDNIAPVAVDATANAIEEGAVVTGQLEATDADDDALTFTLDAPLQGLTLNADGSYSFDPTQNDIVKALTTAGGSTDLVATYTVTDALGATDTGTLTITAAPAPLSFKLTASATTVNEDGSITFTVEANDAVAAATDVVFTLVPGNGTAVDQGTATTNLNDFGQGSFNPVTVTIPANGTKATFTITPPNDDITELAESFSVQAVVAGQTLTATASLLDGSTGAGKTYMLTKGLDNVPGTAGNDTIIGSVDLATNLELNTLSALDIINGGAGVDTLKVSTTQTTAVPLNNLSNVEIVEVTGTAAVTVDTTATTGVTDLKIVAAGGAINADAGATTNVSVAIKAIAAGTAAVDVDGGNNVTVKLTDVADNTNTVSIGTDTDAGGADLGVAAKGDVVVEMTGKAYTTSSTAAVLSNVTVTGGKTVSVTQKAAADTAAAAADTTNMGFGVTQGNITVNANTDTTTVTVKQDAAVTNVNATPKTGGSTETVSVKFGALKALDTLAAGGLTFTAAADMTAAEVAAVFAKLANGTLPVAGDTQGSGLAGKGTYTGVFATSGANGWTSAAASADTVVFTAATANTNVATNLAFTLVGTGTAPVVTTAEGKPHDGGATGGKMGVTAGVVTVAGSTALKTVTIDGYAAGSTITGTAAALETLSLSNGGAFTANVGAATVNLSLENVWTNAAVAATTTAAAVAATAAAVSVGSATTTTLNVKNTGANAVTLTSGAANLNVSGSGLLNAAGSVLATTKAIKVTETAGLNLTGATLTVLETVDTTGTTGATTVTISGTQTTYTGGAGVDTVTVSNAGTIATKAIDLGAGNDKLTLVGATVLAPTAEFKGGEGIDTLSIDVASADALDAAAAFATKVTGFERLELTGAAGTQVIDTAALGNYNDVTVTNSAATSLTLNNLTSGATIRLNDGTNDNTIAAIKGADKSTADVLNIVVTDAARTSTPTVSVTDNNGIIVAAEIETINITTVDGTTEAPINFAADAQNLTLQATKATKIVVTGDTALNLTNVGNVKVAEIDGSAMTAGLTVQAAGGVASTIKGGSGNDVLTASGGAGGGTAQVSTLTFTDGTGTLPMAAGDSIAVTINGNTVTQAFNTSFANTLTLLNGQINGLAAVDSTIAGNVITITAAAAGVPFTANTVFTPAAASSVTGVFAAQPLTTLDIDTITFTNTTAMDAGDSLAFTITDGAGVVSNITQVFTTDFATTVAAMTAQVVAAGYTATDNGTVITITGTAAKGGFTVSNAVFTDAGTTSAVTSVAAQGAVDFLDTATLTLTEATAMGADDTITVTVTDAGGVQTSASQAFTTDYATTLAGLVTKIEVLTGIDAATTALAGNVLTVGSTRGEITNLVVNFTNAANNSVTSAFATTTANITPIGDTLIGGAGNDTLNSGAALGFMTGGEGKDLFVVNAASTNVNAYTTITDFTADDLLQFAGAVAFKSAKVDLGATAVFQDLANAAINALALNEVGWFQFNNGTSTDTYVLMDAGTDGATFNNGQDFIVKIAGVVDLSNASFNNTQDTIALV